MNGEEKVLAVLEQIAGRLDKVDAKLDKVDARLDKVGARLDKLEDTVQVVKNAALKMELVDIQGIKATLELLLSDGDKLDNHEHRIGSLEEMTELNIMEITALKMAK